MFDYVQEQLIERYGFGVVRRGGLRIHTTINPKVQDVARQAIVGQLYDPNDPSAAIVTIDPSNGYIRAMASSTRYQDRTFNLAAQGHRQPGSAFKTMVLTAAIRAGVDPNRTTYVSKPLKHRRPGAGGLRLGGRDLRPHLQRHHDPQERDGRVGQHGLCAADPRRGAEEGLRDRPPAGRDQPPRLLPGRGPRRTHASA